MNTINLGKSIFFAFLFVLSATLFAFKSSHISIPEHSEVQLDTNIVLLASHAKKTEKEGSYFSVQEEHTVNPAFNTVRRAENHIGVPAMIDQQVKGGKAGNRVRIKLLKNVRIGPYQVQKGTVLYGFITGFQTSRVNISVQQIVYDGRPLPVKLDVFDNDGYLGLYVPGSHFREFTKQLGTQKNLGLGYFQMSAAEDTVRSQNKVQEEKPSLLSKLLPKPKPSLTRFISQNSVNINYNQMIYLKENDIPDSLIYKVKKDTKKELNFSIKY